MNIEEIIRELKEKNLIQTTDTIFKKLSGGTVSQLYLIDDSVVVKSNTPGIVEAEAKFLHTYGENNLLPSLLYVQPSYHYLVYSYLPGSTMYPGNKKGLVEDLAIRIINQYRVVTSSPGWGWADEPSPTWQEFLVTRVEAAIEVVKNTFEKHDIQYVLTLLQEQDRYLFISPHLLHGDFGVHNFIFTDGQLSGVIDPTPVYGDPLYDLVYAFCSSPDDLSKETIELAASLLLPKIKPPAELLYQEVLIGLFLRIATCMKHHPHDLEEYLLAWEYWKKVVQKAS